MRRSNSNDSLRSNSRHGKHGKNLTFSAHKTFKESQELEREVSEMLEQALGLAKLQADCERVEEKLDKHLSPSSSRTSSVDRQVYTSTSTAIGKNFTKQEIPTGAIDTARGMRKSSTAHSASSYEDGATETKQPSRRGGSTRNLISNDDNYDADTTTTTTNKDHKPCRRGNACNLMSNSGHQRDKPSSRRCGTTRATDKNKKENLKSIRRGKSFRNLMEDVNGGGDDDGHNNKATVHHKQASSSRGSIVGHNIPLKSSFEEQSGSCRDLMDDSYSNATTTATSADSSFPKTTKSHRGSRRNLMDDDSHATATSTKADSSFPKTTRSHRGSRRNLMIGDKNLPRQQRHRHGSSRRNLTDDNEEISNEAFGGEPPRSRGKGKERRSSRKNLLVDDDSTEDDDDDANILEATAILNGDMLRERTSAEDRSTSRRCVGRSVFDCSLEEVIKFNMSRAWRRSSNKKSDGVESSVHRQGSNDESDCRRSKVTRTHSSDDALKRTDHKRADKNRHGIRRAKSDDLRLHRSSAAA